MVNEFCGFKHGVIGTDKMPADTTLNNMKKADLIKLLHTAQHNYETLMYFYNNAVNANMAQLSNNGWIPCSERLPDKYCHCLVTRRNDYKDGSFDSDVREDVYIELEGVWDWQSKFEGLIDNIIAWQPLPAPYKPTAQQDSISEAWKQQTMSRFERVE